MRVRAWVGGLAKVSVDEYSTPIDCAVTRELESLPLLPGLIDEVVEYWNTPQQNFQYCPITVDKHATLW